jgi:hypothetical protein
VNILAIAYPTSERGQFDPVVERMEDTFKPSQQCAHASMLQSERPGSNPGL